VVVVTEHGFENLTTCPRTIEEVESVMAGGVWPPAVDKAPELKRNWTTLGPDGEGMVPLSIVQG
jgi:Xaa-Pro dipeptidase